MIAITPPLRRGLFLLVVGLLVLEGCFAFPLVNLTLPEYDRALLGYRLHYFCLSVCRGAGPDALRAPLPG